MAMKRWMATAVAALALTGLAMAPTPGGAGESQLAQWSSGVDSSGAITGGSGGGTGQAPAFPTNPQPQQPTQPSQGGAPWGGGGQQGAGQGHAYDANSAARPSAQDMRPSQAVCGRTITLRARQIRGQGGRNAHIDWGYAKLGCAGRITAVHHDGRAGFWIWNNDRLLSAWSEAEGVGQQLQPGDVWLAPNMAPRQNVANVSVTISVGGGGGGNVNNIVPGRWNTEAGVGQFSVYGHDFQGTFDGVVQVAGHLQNGTMGGYWFFHGKEKICKQPRNGTYAWGRISMTFRNGNPPTLTGMAGACQDELTWTFSGTKSGSADAMGVQSTGRALSSFGSLRSSGGGHGGGYSAPQAQPAPTQSPWSGGSGRFR